MAILLGALFVLGQETGPNMLTYHVDVVFIMIFTIIIGNFIRMLGDMFLINPLSRTAGIRGSVLLALES